jgi:hypothetical protein
MASVVGKPYQTLMSELSCQPGHKLGADLVLPLCRVLGSTEPVSFLARQLGCVLTKLPDVNPTNSDIAKNLATAVREFSQFISACAPTIDREMSTHEADRIYREGLDAIESITVLFKAAFMYSKQN